MAKLTQSEAYGPGLELLHQIEALVRANRAEIEQLAETVALTGATSTGKGLQGCAARRAAEMQCRALQTLLLYPLPPGDLPTPVPSYWSET